MPSCCPTVFDFPPPRRSDWADDILAQIRGLYLRHTDARGSTSVKLQGLEWESKDAGRLPLEQYLAATLIERQALASGKKTLDAVARERAECPVPERTVEHASRRRALAIA